MSFASRLQRGKSEAGKRGQPARAVYRPMGIWKRDNGSISITCANPVTGDPEFHTTVTNLPGSVRYHRNLFGKLRAILEAEGRW